MASGNASMADWDPNEAPRTRVILVDSRVLTGPRCLRAATRRCHPNRDLQYLSGQDPQQSRPAARAWRPVNDPPASPVSPSHGIRARANFQDRRQQRTTRPVQLPPWDDARSPGHSRWLGSAGSSPDCRPSPLGLPCLGSGASCPHNGGPPWLSRRDRSRSSRMAKLACSTPDKTDMGFGSLSALRAPRKHRVRCGTRCAATWPRRRCPAVAAPASPRWPGAVRSGSRPSRQSCRGSPRAR